MEVYFPFQRNSGSPLQGRERPMYPFCNSGEYSVFVLSYQLRGRRLVQPIRAGCGRGLVPAREDGGGRRYCDLWAAEGGLFFGERGGWARANCSRTRNEGSGRGKEYCSVSSRCVCLLWGDEYRAGVAICAARKNSD